MTLASKCAAEVFGTFWLTFGGCGSAVLAAAVFIKEGASPINIGIGLVGVSLAFGLTVVTMAYAIGHISGCHLNPAVSLGLLVGGRFKFADFIPYVIAQVIGATAGAAVLYVIASGGKDWTGITPGAGAFATNGYGDFSPKGYTLTACATAEFVLTFFFLLIILGSTDSRAPAGFAALPIGLGLTLIHLIGIPVTNLSVNPARSTGPAIVAMIEGFKDPVSQLWLFWAAPLAGAAVAGIVYQTLFAKSDDRV